MVSKIHSPDKNSLQVPHNRDKDTGNIQAKAKLFIMVKREAFFRAPPPSRRGVKLAYTPIISQQRLEPI